MTQIAIIGTGVIGTGWCARLIANGHKVKAWDPAKNFGDRLQSEMKRLWPILKKSGMTEGSSIFNLSICTTLAEACVEADLIQESVPEDIEIKKTIHHEIDSVSRQKALIVSSSSGLLPSEIQSDLSHPERFVIGHPFNPVYILPLVEVVGGSKTSTKTIKDVKDFYKSMGMYPLEVRKEIEGYLSDRLQEAQWREILHLVKDGVANTQELDDAIIYGPGLRWAMMGTCLTFHLAGGDAGMRHMLEQFGPALKLPWTKLEAPELTEDLIERLVEGTQLQAGDKTIDELGELRDSCLIEIIQALKKYQIGAGRLL
ncbi:MAG: 3-hydroxyacyl-CoA dehydrogenase NAD-binding domain-containing protein [Woeseiaceae bacterium]|nr:3-hydroxyacyl-CoA dehydrogenase NAD-binding domain-containing protein [Woeseiaceae bacterium]MDG1864742.1 3-hydroxyacyl-CoA dehydrogenase NAD-binding domain-containing protein [Woeseiaceae bacterium]